MTTLADLESDNPNLGQQLSIWRQERIQNNEDGYDYQAFRQHVMAIGAPDPGEEAFEEFGGRETGADRSSRGGPRAE